MSAIGLGSMTFPIMALVLAIIFSPIGLTTTSNCSLGTPIIGNTGCALQFQSQATIVLSTSGYSLYNQGYQTCQSASGVNNIPILGYLANLPVLSNIYDFFAWAGASLGNIFNSNSAIATICSAQTGNILVFNFTGQDLVFQLIGIVITAGAIAALTGISFVGSGSNSAGTYIVFMVTSLSLLWIVLSAFSLPTFVQIPTIIGGTIYTLLTLMYAFGIVEIIS